MKKYYAVTISAIVAIMLVSGTTAAFANPGHSVSSPNPASKIIGPGGTITFDLIVSPEQNAPVVGDFNFHVLDVMPFGASVSNLICPSQAANGATSLGLGDVQTALDDSGVPGIQFVSANFPGDPACTAPGVNCVAPAPIVRVAVGPTMGNPVIFSDGGSQAPGPLTPYQTGTSFTPLVGSPQWQVSHAPGNGPLIGTLGIPNAVLGPGNTLWSCGCDDNQPPDPDGAGPLVGGDGICGQGDPRGIASESYTIETTVSGELIPISATALLLAGISSNALWILPALGGVAGLAFTVLKLQVSRKTI